MTSSELQQAILRDKERGVPDLEIGRKYGVTFKYIERLVTQVQGINISTLKRSRKIATLTPKYFKEEQSTIWSFKRRGKWATHSGEYRGNWSPYIPRNVILKYSEPGELVLDYFSGAGTTAVEAKLLGRRCIAVDINEKAIELARENVNFSVDKKQLNLVEEIKEQATYEPELLVGDARDLMFLEDDSIDLICAHPPYANIIQYTDSAKGDLSFLDIEDFLREMKMVAKESFRVLKPGRQCAILIGDTRRKKHIIPLGFALINVYLDAGFRLRELVIKRQHNCKTTGFWYSNSIRYNFLLLAHEYLPIFEKPFLSSERVSRDIGKTALVRESISPQKLKDLETTTVWVFPEGRVEELLDRNVIERYANDKGYSVEVFTSEPAVNNNSTENRGKTDEGLLYIKSQFLKDSLSYEALDNYIAGIEKRMIQASSSMMNGSFVVIQTQDVRIDQYVEPLAKRVVDRLKHNNFLWLKEIVTATPEGVNGDIHVKGEYLNIIHKYLLVYEVK